MSNMEKTEVDESVSMEDLSARWDTIAFRAQGSPFEELSISTLAKNSGVRRWSRPGSVKGDVLARYIYFSFEELLEGAHAMDLHFRHTPFYFWKFVRQLFHLKKSMRTLHLLKRLTVKHMRNECGLSKNLVFTRIIL